MSTPSANANLTEVQASVSIAIIAKCFIIRIIIKLIVAYVKLINVFFCLHVYYVYRVLFM